MAVAAANAKGNNNNSKSAVNGGDSSAAAAAMKTKKGPSAEEALRDTLMMLARFFLVIISLYCSYKIRLYAVEVYGRVIHEFDPWFNFRATQYLVDNGWKKFFTWYDHSVWYPLGRPVGSTIYPGMQFTAAGIYNALKYLGYDISLNDVCVFIPAGFSCLACLFTAGIAYEASHGHKASAFAITVGIMSILPAHLMRSVAGGYDNESVAVTAITSTFYFWVRSLRGPGSWPISFLAAASYFYMVAAWGGYTFVLNMVGLHAVFLLFSGRFTWNLHKAYAIFYLVGTAAATTVPVVGWMPLQSMEQMGPLFVLGIMQLYAYVETKKRGLSEREFKAFCKQMAGLGFVAVVVALFAIVQSGKVGPLSARVRGLFVPHTRTGNPLVDSVAEHQATQGDVYWKYFHFTVFTAPAGMIMSLSSARTDARMFVAAYYLVALYFSSKMVRLVLLLGPASACASGVALGALADWVASEAATISEVIDPNKAAASAAAAAAAERGGDNKSAGGRAARRNNDKRGLNKRTTFRISEAPKVAEKFLRENANVRKAIAAVVVSVSFTIVYSFIVRSHIMASQMSEPSIIVRGRSSTGEPIMLDDFREAYWWLRDNTPEDARVMSWWDYGYQINGVANRTTVADGNTWNHEHIALLGKCLTSPEEEGHKIVRHLADYVLVWSTRFAGMMGDDLAKSPHMARIAGSVYPDVSQEGFFIDEKGVPSDSMRESLLYRIHSYGMDPRIAPLKHYEEVYMSKFKMVRIWKVLDVDEDSKAFIASGKNRQCDAGGWYCPGSYPEALREVLAKKRDFKMVH